MKFGPVLDVESDMLSPRLNVAERDRRFTTTSISATSAGRDEVGAHPVPASTQARPSFGYFRQSEWMSHTVIAIAS